MKKVTVFRIYPDSVNAMKKVEFKDWGVGLISGILGVILTLAVTLYTFRENLNATNRIESFRLTREFSQEFKHEIDLYRLIRQTVEACLPLYKSWGGEFNHDQLNRYLGFFEDLAFFEKEGVLEPDIIDFFFGAYLIEAYEHKQVQRYITEIRANSMQPKAFTEFERLAQILEAKPHRKALVDQLEQARCSSRMNERQ